MSTILDEIVARKRLDVAAAKAAVPLDELRRQLSNARPVRDFATALDRPGEVTIIAEIKAASPSAGVIREPFDPAAIAQAYQRGGAACLSVLTDQPYFRGSLSDMRSARAACDLPVLRKDFIVDEYQLVEARVHGADAVLLIAEVLAGNLLKRLHDLAISLGLSVLVEFHDDEQLDRVLACGARLVGINNRDLRRFETRLERTLELASRVPPDRLLVSESGIRTTDDVARLRAVGVRAILVGESLLRQPDPEMALQQLLTGRSPLMAMGG